ncbi:hypothetical protein PoB_006504800 [Plakobranchus ocellatus]|uniref:Uncharacterized protein n=1 Tax=Plakobranchus ocellatus TaxID=259542 RepID=A0AAV4D3C8_9GAST|nr:hypothetical protein PoB_006504800 [Plakobranchus ocellatus]
MSSRLNAWKLGDRDGERQEDKRPPITTAVAGDTEMLFEVPVLVFSFVQATSLRSSGSSVTLRNWDLAGSKLAIVWPKLSQPAVKLSSWRSTAAIIAALTGADLGSGQVSQPR